MIKNSLLTLTLLIPMLAFAKTTTVGKEAPIQPKAKIVVSEAPIPDCLPCPPPKQDPTLVAREAPIPDCLPCPPPNQGPMLVAREAPIPDCLPCPPPNQGPMLVARAASNFLHRGELAIGLTDRKRDFDFDASSLRRTGLA